MISKAVSFRNACRNISDVLAIDGINDDRAAVEEFVKRASGAASWLFTVDNADNPGHLDGSTNLACHLPFSRHGSLLFTSRNPGLELQLDVPTINAFTVEGVSENDSLKFLRLHRTMSNLVGEIVV